MKNKTTAILTAATLLAFFAAQLFLPAPSSAKDYGNILKRKQTGIKAPEDEEKKELEDYQKDFDTDLRIYLSSTTEVFQPGETPVIDVYLKNENIETRFFKNIWSASGAEGVYFKTIFDDRETWGSAVFTRETVLPESTDPAHALQLDPGQQAHIMRIKFNEIPEGEHTLEVEYRAGYTVTEKVQRSWWSGLSRSNKLTLLASRVVPGDELGAAATTVIEKVHSDIMAMKGKFPEISAYGGSNITKPGDSHLSTPVIDFNVLAPKRRTINIYFQKPDYQPSTMSIFEEEFPYLGIKLFVHLDTGEDTRLRTALLDIIKRDKKSLYNATKEIAMNLRVEVAPFGPEMSKKLRRASYIVLGTVVTKQIEDVNPHENYNIRKWILNVAVRKTFTGDVREKMIIVKSGALTTFFGNEQIEDKDFVLLLGSKNNWQKEYTLIGVEPARENLLQWLAVKYP